MKFLIIFALAFAKVSTKDLYSRSIEVPLLENEGRISNGKLALPGQFSYQVGINNIKGIIVIWCGGSIISTTWVLTASHCIDGASVAEVYLGATQRLHGMVAYTISSDYMILHPEWDPTTIKNDIGLIRIPKTSMSSRIGLIKIPSNNNDRYLNDIVVIAGWGFTGDTQKSQVLSNDLKYATLEVSLGLYCSASYDLFFDYATQICVNTPHLVSACFGDSGGPLVLESVSVQIGVYSFTSEKGCKLGHPIVSTRVAAYLPWIKAITGISY